MYFPSALCLRSGSVRDSLSLLSRGEGGVTRKTFILCVLEVKQKNEKKCPEHFKKIIHVIWPWRRIKKQQQKEISSVKALERDKHGGYETWSSRWEPWNSSFRRRNWEIITLYIYFHVQKTDMLTDGLVWRALSARPSKTFHETRCQEVWNAAHGHARYGCQARFVSQWPLKIAIPVWLVDVTSHHVTQHRAPYFSRQVMSHNGTLGTNMAMGFLFLLLKPIPV